MSPSIFKCLSVDLKRVKELAGGAGAGKRATDEYIYLHSFKETRSNHGTQITNNAR